MKSLDDITCADLIGKLIEKGKSLLSETVLVTYS